MPGIYETDLIRRIYDKYPYASFLCPTDLYIDLIRINNLRERRAMADRTGSRSASRRQSGNIDAQARRVCYNQEADQFLRHIISCDVYKWAAEKDADRGHVDDWASIGTMYRDAMVVFAVLSLSIAPATATDQNVPPISGSEGGEQLSLLDLHVQQLAMTIDTIAKRKEPISMAACWPMIVLGVAPNLRTIFDHRDLVSRCLSRLAVEHGTALPFRAKEVLETFWASGKTSWDECFDQAYAFFT
jgi:hypothetical protein